MHVSSIVAGRVLVNYLKKKKKKKKAAFANSQGINAPTMTDLKLVYILMHEIPENLNNWFL